MGYNGEKKIMRKVLFFLTIIVSITLMSCGSSNITTLPIATNTINTVSFKELNLEREDYKILNTIEVSANVTVSYDDEEIEVSDDTGFHAKYWLEDGIEYCEFDGVLRAGFLTNDYGHINLKSPDQVARAAAFNRLINMAKEVGGDAIIEPIVSTNLELKEKHWGKETYVFSTTASGKVLVIKTDK